MASRAWTPKSLVWNLAEPFEGAAELARQANTAPIVAQLLANRGARTPEAAEAMLNPKLTDLHDPSLLSGATEAAATAGAGPSATRKRSSSTATTTWTA